MQSGCVYLRDGGDKFGACHFAQAIAHEYGIEYASPVFPIYQKGNYGSFIGRGFQTIDEYQALVDEVLACKGTFVKIMVTGILDFNQFGLLTGYALPSDLLIQMVTYAHKKNLSVMAHVNGARAVEDAVSAGVDSIEHGYYMDDIACEALASSSTIWIPTLAPICNLIGTGLYLDSELVKIVNAHTKAIAKVAKMGGLIACGSDAGASKVTHEQGFRDEYALLELVLEGQCDELITKGLSALRGRFPGGISK